MVILVNMNKKSVNTDKVIRRYNRYSYVYDFMEAIAEKIAFKKWRTKVFSHAKGRCLEVGSGTGKNFEYCPENTQMVAIDISEGMINKAKKRANEKDVDMVIMDVQNLAFKDNVFDTVIMTFVLCSVPDPIKGVSECVRVCKDEGKIINLEHVLSKNRAIAFFEYLMNPFTSRIFGFNVNRDTRRNLESGGVEIIEDEKLAFGDVFRFFVSVPKKKQ